MIARFDPGFDRKRGRSEDLQQSRATPFSSSTPLLNLTISTTIANEILVIMLSSW